MCWCGVKVGGGAVGVIGLNAWCQGGWGVIGLTSWCQCGASDRSKFMVTMGDEAVDSEYCKT